MNASGHVPVVLNLLDGTQGVFNFTAPGVSTQVARGGVAGVTAIGPRVSINDSDQVVYRATVGGVDHLFRFTPPATTATIVSVGDVVNGKTISSIGAFSDINNGGNVVYGAFYNGDNNSAFYFWDGTNHEVASGGTADPPALSSEMITLNNANQVAYVTGTTTGPDETDGASEGHEADNAGEGAFLWTLAGGSVKFIANGDVISGGAVTLDLRTAPVLREAAVLLGRMPRDRVHGGRGRSGAGLPGRRSVRPAATPTAAESSSSRAARSARRSRCRRRRSRAARRARRTASRSRRSAARRPTRSRKPALFRTGSR